MTETELIDRILTICKNHAKPIHIKRFLKERDGLDLTTTEFKMNFAGAIKTLKHHNLIVETETQIGGDHFITTSPTGHHFLKDYGSYSLFLESRNQSQSKNTQEATTKRVTNIGKIILFIIFGLSSGILGWLNYTDNKTIDKLQDTINKYEQTIKTLTKERDSIQQRTNNLEKEIKSTPPNKTQTP